jgi:hypothetical protein
MLTGNSCNTSLVAHPVAQRETVDQFGEDEVRAVVLTDVEDGEDVRVAEGRGRAGLAREAGQGLLV